MLPLPNASLNGSPGKSVWFSADENDNANAVTSYTNAFGEDFIAENFAPTFAPSSNNISVWGPKRDSLCIVIPITVIYAIIFLTGVVGNVSTCIVIARNKSMHTATNYYLFSLAVSDLLLLVSGLPPEMYFMWSKFPYVFGEAFCILQGFAAETSANATVLTITAFTVERYIAICHPFLSHTMSKLSRAVKFVVAIWIVSMCLAIPQAMAFGIVYEIRADGQILDMEHSVCSIKQVIVPHAFEISTFVFFVAPMSLITILYVLIGVQLRRSTGPRRGNSPGSASSVKLKHRTFRPISMANHAVVVVNKVPDGIILDVENEDGRKNYPRNAPMKPSTHVVKMLVVVVVAFFICWAPFHAQRLLAIYGQTETPPPEMVTAFKFLTYLSGIFYYLSTTVNPLLYNIMSNKFREAFKDTFARYLGRRRRTPGGKCYSTLSGRSSQINSNTDSGVSHCSRQSSLRYLEADIARLHECRRPVVVSFRRKPLQAPQPKQVPVLDTDLSEVLDRLRDEPNKKMRSRTLLHPPYPQPAMHRRHHHHHHHRRHGSSGYSYRNVPVYPQLQAESDPHTSTTDCSYIELHNVQPVHVCSISCIQNETELDQDRRETFPVIEDIEIFQEQRLQINSLLCSSGSVTSTASSSNRNNHGQISSRSGSVKSGKRQNGNETDDDDATATLQLISKSFTVPNIDYFSNNNGNVICSTVASGAPPLI